MDKLPNFTFMTTLFKYIYIYMCVCVLLFFSIITKKKQKNCGGPSGGERERER